MQPFVWKNKRDVQPQKWRLLYFSRNLSTKLNLTFKNNVPFYIWGGGGGKKKNLKKKRGGAFKWPPNKFKKQRSKFFSQKFYKNF